MRSSGNPYTSSGSFNRTEAQRAPPEVNKDKSFVEMVGRKDDLILASSILKKCWNDCEEDSGSRRREVLSENSKTRKEHVSVRHSGVSSSSSVISDSLSSRGF